MWFIVVEVEQETGEPLPTKNPGSAPENNNSGPIAKSVNLECLFTPTRGNELS